MNCYLKWQKDFADGIKAKDLKWTDYPRLSVWTFQSRRGRQQSRSERYEEKEEAGETQLALLTLEMEEEGDKPWNAATSSSWE